LVAAFDDLCRNGSVLYDVEPQAEEQFYKFVQNAGEWRRKQKVLQAEKSQISASIVEKDNELSGKLMQIKQARQYLQEERAARIKAEARAESAEKQLRLIQDLVFSDRGHQTLSNDTLVKLRTLDRNPSSASNYASQYGGSPQKENRDLNNVVGGGGHHLGLPVVDESVESLLDASDLSFEDTREDIMNGSRQNNKSRHARRSGGHNTSRPQRRPDRRSSFAKRKSHEGGGTTMSNMFPNLVENLNNINSAVIAGVSAGVDPSQQRIQEIKEKAKRARLAEKERIQEEVEDENDLRTPVRAHAPVSTPTTAVKRTFSNASAVANNRPHSFQKKSGLMAERCNPCGKRVKFGKTVYKCRDCAVTAHEQCMKDVPLPCLAGGSRTPQNKATGNFLADFTPIEAPMIPALLIYCIKEIEARGMDDVGIYRVAGSEADANEILDKFRRGGPPQLARYEIHAVTSCLKKFLRQLKEPVIPLSLWQVFVDAARDPDTTDAETAMYQAISELPQPNRDTLAYLIVHLQAVASNSKVNKMNVDNLAMVMGPTILGNSSNDPMAVMTEVGSQKAVVSALMGISSDYWSHFLAVEDDKLMLRSGTQGHHNQAILSPHTPDQQLFATPLAGGGLTTTGGPVARRTGSKQLFHNNKEFSKKQQLFQSPMLL